MLQATSQNFRADETCDVISAFAPIDARSAENSPAARIRCRFCAENRKEMCPRVRHLTTIISENDVSSGNKRIGDRHPKLTS
jgi:hypothetical protein